MADETQPSLGARRAADDAPTTILPVLGGRGGARRFVTPDWDDDDDDSESHADTTTPVWVPLAGRASTTSPQVSPPETPPGDTWSDVPLPASVVPPPRAGSAPAAITPLAAPSDDHDAFRPPRDDADTVVIKRGDLASALATMGIMAAPEPETAEPAPAEPDNDEPPVVRPATPTWTPVAPAAPAPAPAEVEPDPEPKAARLSAMERLAAMRSSSGSSGSGGHPPSDRPSSRPAWLIPVALVAVLALLVGATVVWWNTRSSGSVAKAPTSQSASAVALTDADLAGVADAALALPLEWTIDATTSPAADPTALCLTQVAGMPSVAGSFQRKLVSGPATMIHRMDAYGSVADAITITTLRLAQLGRCSNVPVYLSSGATISGLGDQAAAITAVVQDPTPIMHTVVLVRTGSVVDVVDVWQPTTPIAVEKAMATAAAVVGKQCAKAGGACVTTPDVKVGPPPSGGVAGWLTVSDLPRITPGFGRWTASDPVTTIRVIGSQCENVSFATAQGPTQRRQRTYLLTEDSVPKGFGLDELLLDFETAEAAAAFAKSVTDNIDSCATRVPTAKLGATGTFTGVGASGEAIAGYWRTVSQPTSAATTATFRIVVATAGKRVVYLLLTPSGAYDFSDDSWAAAGLRAAQRSTQQA